MNRSASAALQGLLGLDHRKGYEEARARLPPGSLLPMPSLMPGAAYPGPGSAAQAPEPRETLEEKVDELLALQRRQEMREDLERLLTAHAALQPVEQRQAWAEERRRVLGGLTRPSWAVG